MQHAPTRWRPAELKRPAIKRNQPDGRHLQRDMIEWSAGSSRSSSLATCSNALCRGNRCLLMLDLGFTLNDLQRLQCGHCHVCQKAKGTPATRRPRAMLPTFGSTHAQHHAIQEAACSHRCRNSTCGNLYLHGLSCSDVAALGSSECSCNSCCSTMGFSFPALILSRYEERDDRYERAQLQARLGGFSPSLTRGRFGRTSQCHPVLPLPNASHAERASHIRQVMVDNYVQSMRRQLKTIIARGLPHVLFDDDVVLTTTRVALVRYLERTTSRFDMVPLGGCIYGSPAFFEFACSHAMWVTPYAAEQMLRLTEPDLCSTFHWGFDRIAWMQLCWHRRVRCAPWLHLTDVYEATTTGNAKWKPFHDELRRHRNESGALWESVRVNWGTNEHRDLFGVGYYVQDRKHFKPYLHRKASGNPNLGLSGHMLWADERLVSKSRRAGDRAAPRRKRRPEAGTRGKQHT